MSRIWLPPQHDVALALRDPNLLVPNRQPASMRINEKARSELVAYWPFRGERPYESLVRPEQAAWAF